MRISELSETTGVPLATLKYYLREGLLQPGVAMSKTRAEYDDTHVERVRLVRALTETGGLSLAAVARVLTALDSPDAERLGVLGAAQVALHEGTTVPADPSDWDGRPVSAESPSRAARFAASRGWRIFDDTPSLADLDAAWEACDVAGVGVDEARMGAYADAVERIADVDLDTVPADPAAAVRQVVLGTVLVDPVLVALRRLAQQHQSIRRHEGGGSRPGESPAE